jgi:hypothetical protein
MDAYSRELQYWAQELKTEANIELTKMQEAKDILKKFAL